MFDRNTIEKEIGIPPLFGQEFQYEINPIHRPTDDKKKNNVDQSVAFLSTPKPIPQDVKQTYFWPLISPVPQSYSVPYIFGPKYTDAKGAAGRSFYGVRGADRWHGANDFLAPKDSQILACQNGKILSFVRIFYWSTMDKFGRMLKVAYDKKEGQNNFYALKDKEVIRLYHDDKGLIYTHPNRTNEYQCAKYTSAIYVHHKDKIILYGEVAADSLVRACLKVGDEVKAGQIIGFVGGNPGNNNMLHAEAWIPEVVEEPYTSGSFRRWLIGTKPNQYRRDPTKYFDFILKHGTVLKPGDKAFSKCKSEPNNIPSIPTTVTPNSTTSFISKFTDYIRSAKYIAAIGLALTSGVKDPNKLTDLIFYALHPERNGTPIRADEPELKRKWISINKNVKIIISKLNQNKQQPTGIDNQSKNNLPSNTIFWKPDKNVLQRIEKYDSIIKKESTVHNIKSSLVKGIIYSESGGNPDTGKGTTGYKGLMQASKSISHLDPETSIREGIKHFIDFKNKTLKRLKNNGLDPSNLGENAIINVVMRSYNAGTATVAKAIEYAKESGNINNWMEEPHYKRGIFYYGAFSYHAAVLNKIKNKTTDNMINIISQLTNLNKADIVKTYKIGDIQKISSTQFYGLIENSIKQILKKSYKPNPKYPKTKIAVITFDQLVELAKNDIGYKLVLYSIHFKYINTQKYVDRIIMVKEYYDRRT